MVSSSLFVWSRKGLNPEMRMYVKQSCSKLESTTVFVLFTHFLSSVLLSISLSANMSVVALLFLCARLNVVPIIVHVVVRIARGLLLQCKLIACIICVWLA